ncbi:MAG: amidohydrolase family protein [Candidatus Gastranaerophilales bacterium]|nr:amidohydrolase family protein [Candidatus Gastranaerophilales bacterium]MCM1073592.1 amidohydrolase family protein [Bacteroides sp.]
MRTPLLIEQHLHGAFGVDFNKAGAEDILFAAKKLREHGIGGFFPTLVTDSVENIKRQTAVIKEASRKSKAILGIHLEGIFINPEKKGIHNPEHFLPLTVENYQLIEDDFIKIVTLAPELDEGLIDYLHQKGVKVQAGHCVGGDLSKVDGVTHLFNAMSGISHRGKSTALSALTGDVYTEIIADGVHVSDDALKLVFKATDKIILISDALPITYSDMKETVFADSKIYYDGVKATSTDGTIAGSTTLLDGIVKRLIKLGLFKPEYIENVYRYHGIEPMGEIEWGE